MAVTKGDGKGSKETVKLGELAQVIPKGGRMLTILVGEEEVYTPFSVFLFFYILILLSIGPLSGGGLSRRVPYRSDSRPLDTHLAPTTPNLTSATNSVY